MTDRAAVADLPRFDRSFDRLGCARIGSGSLGGKAAGLVLIRDFLASDSRLRHFPGVSVAVPGMTVLASGVFDRFMEDNKLAATDWRGLTDARIGALFQAAELPVEILGDLRSLAARARGPLAIRSSSFLEDAREAPFAGVYATKMIPNRHWDPDIRCRRLVEAIKLVYASTYFAEARDYAPGATAREKMAVIIQEVVGRDHGARFYPDLAGVARSYNFYPVPPARRADGAVSLALGLGKTIVDGETSWNFSPAYPGQAPPFASVQEMLEDTQTTFWAVNMGPPPAYDPVSEVEYLVRANLAEAEADEVLRWSASTYDPGRGRVMPGIGNAGARILNFAPLLLWQEFPLNAVLRRLLQIAEQALGDKVEIEFAATFAGAPQPVMRLGFLQVRPIALASQLVEVAPGALADPGAVVASEMAIGNGVCDDVQDILYLVPERFSAMQTRRIAEQVEGFNRELVRQRRPYLLVGFGRWGTSQPSLGVPVTWSQVAGARAIVEAITPAVNAEPSQGSHFFHNLVNSRASYLVVTPRAPGGIAWDWLARQPVAGETQYVRHARPPRPLSIRVDGRSGRGVVLARGDSAGRT